MIIFDECHRTQFGEMHTAVTKAFKRYNLFGFTGTPIFAANAVGGGKPHLKTTEQAFGDRLHTYTIVDAITDKNVLPFRIDYVDTVRVGAVDDKQVSAIDTERALLAPERIAKIVSYTLDHFDQKTKRNENYTLGERRVRGFNALFATASIDAARRYYNAFQRQQETRPAAKRLTVGLIYSYAANEVVADGTLDDEAFDTYELPDDARSFLEDAIQDYNDTFATSFDTSAERFQNYYKDLSLRLRNREIDLVIVVNMFLTGFDATTLNTLFVDKNLRAHGLIQAFSRTNRILNSVKTYGNIVSFRNREDQTTAALELFGNKDAGGIVLLKPYGEYHAAYAAAVADLLGQFPLGRQIVGESAQKQFIALFGSILRLRNILTSFDEFDADELLSPRQVQDYQSVYLDLYSEFRRDRGADKEQITDDVVFEIELVKQVEVSVDYILMLVQQWRDEHPEGQDVEIRVEINRALDASPSLRNKRDLVQQFVDSVSLHGAIDDQWRAFVAARREAELAQIVSEERLRPEATRDFLAGAFRDGRLHTTGTAITKVLPPVSRFTAGGDRATMKQRVIDKLSAFFDRFFGLG